MTKPRLQTRWLGCGVLVCAWLACGHLAAAEQPNIVLILADDLGWQEAGFMGSDFFETPHLDRLAREGMVFHQAYAAAANCAPSRACLLSGQYTPRHGVYAVGHTKRGPIARMRMLPIPNRSGLKAEEFTLPKALKSAGYVTGMFGKWHLGGKDGSSPEQHFDVVAVSGQSWKRNKQEDPKGAFSITEAACAFLEKNRSRPFFLYLPHYAVHTPLEARPETIAKFQQKAPGRRHRNAKYAACLAELDASVGLLMQKLAELELEKNTLVVFTSDNGGITESQEPLRGRKGCYYEGGVREPMIVRWPNVVRGGTRCDVPVIHVDVYPTFLEAAGVERPTGRVLDGANLLPLLKGAPAFDRESLFWHFPGYLDRAVPRGRDPVFRTRPVSVIRQGDWKLFLYHEEWQLDGGRNQIDTNHSVELYHVVNDPGERTNLAADQPEKRDELLAGLLAWISETAAPLPTQRNPAYRPAVAKGPQNAASPPGKTGQRDSKSDRNAKNATRAHVGKPPKARTQD